MGRLLQAERRGVGLLCRGEEWKRTREAKVPSAFCATHRCTPVPAGSTWARDDGGLEQ